MLPIPESVLWIAMFESLPSLYFASSDSWRNWLILDGPARSRVTHVLLLAVTICTWARVGGHITLTTAPVGSRKAGGCCHAPWETRCYGCSEQAKNTLEIEASASKIVAGFYQIQNAKTVLGSKKLYWHLHVLSECHSKLVTESQLASSVPFSFINTVVWAVQSAITGEPRVSLQSLPSAGHDSNFRKEIGLDCKLASLSCTRRKV